MNEKKKFFPGLDTQAVLLQRRVSILFRANLPFPLIAIGADCVSLGRGIFWGAPHGDSSSQQENDRGWPPYLPECSSQAEADKGISTLVFFHFDPAIFLVGKGEKLLVSIDVKRYDFYQSLLFCTNRNPRCNHSPIFIQQEVEDNPRESLLKSSLRFLHMMKKGPIFQLRRKHAMSAGRGGVFSWTGVYPTGKFSSSKVPGGLPLSPGSAGLIMITNSICSALVSGWHQIAVGWCMKIRAKRRVPSTSTKSTDLHCLLPGTQI